MKIKAKAKDCQLLVKVKIATGETVDEKELDRFARLYIRGFLKPRLTKKNLIEYAGPVGISLQERLKKPISKRDFLFILEQIVVAVQKLQVNRLEIGWLEMSLPLIFMNEVTKEVQFLYVPVTGIPKTQNLIQLIESIVYSVRPMMGEDADAVSRFIYFFNAMRPFDLAKVEMFVAKEDRSVVNTIRKQNAGQSGFMTNKQQHYYEHYEGQEVPKDEEDTDLLADIEEATDLLADEEATGLLDDSEEATGLLDDGEEATGLLAENQADVHYPSLFRVLTEETILINKPVFRLGKERSYVDYFVTNNIAVSRSHADIITRGNRCFVKDLNSRNHTYINGWQLSAHCEVELHEGDSLKLGNEEFVFHA